MAELNIEKVEGEGTPLVFIHGWRASKDDWNKIRENLSIENPLVFYDQRCHGDSECKNFNIEDLAEDLETITEDMDSPVIIGHSMGGMAALKYSTISDNYSCLILLATSASRPIKKYFSASYLAESMKKTLTKSFSAISCLKPLNKLKSSGSFNLGGFVYGLKAIIMYDVRDKLEEEEALVVSGTNDRVIPSSQSKEVAELLNCEHKEIKSSHHIPRERPEKLSEIIENFLEKQIELD